MYFVMYLLNEYLMISTKTHCVSQNTANAFLKYSDIQNVQSFLNTLRLSIYYSLQMPMSHCFRYVCMALFQQLIWLCVLDMFTTVANKAKSVSMCVKKHFIFEIPKISITHLHCKLGMSAEVNLPLILVNCNFNTKRYLSICS